MLQHSLTHTGLCYNPRILMPIRFKSFVRKILMHTPLWDLRQAHLDRAQRTADEAAIQIWQKNDFPVPPPESVKRRTLAAYGSAFQIDTLIETGTFKGDTIRALREQFQQLYSIELSHELAVRAQYRFRKHSKIKIIEGDSGAVLPTLLSNIHTRCLFWLDGHYSGGVTAQGNIDTPINQELQIIFSHPIRDHVFLIDDARLFNGTQDYPTIDTLKGLFAEMRPDFQFSVANDVIRACPPGDVKDPFAH